MSVRARMLGRQTEGVGETARDQPDFDDKRAELTEHLAELRTRIVRSASYLAIGMLAMYWVEPQIFRFVSAPIITALHEIARRLPPSERAFTGGLVFHNFYEPFFLHLKISFVCGIIVAVPLITMEIWGFVVPALTPSERRPFRLIAPFSVALFMSGVALALFLMPLAVNWFLTFLYEYPSAVLLQDPEDYIMFVVKMMLAFGLVFQLPIVLMGLGKFGIVRSNMMTKYWRYCVIGITAAAMIISPSNDPISMILMAIPLVVLFFLSIWLVKMVEPRAA